jgi:serine/threonine protein kinase
MIHVATCPRCQSPLAADAPEGLCPACLMAGGLGSAPQGTPGSAVTTPWTDEKCAAAAAELAPHFPQLEILELLGQGGMGAVYKARQKHLDRFVALKVIPPASANEPAFAERFAREARALARLNHPNIVMVHDFGQAGGIYYLLMEFVDGANLRQSMGAGQLQPEEALAIVPLVCDALQYAHDQGVVHRDVKPENVLLDKAGHVKIADFGLAKLLHHSPGDFTLTRSRQIMGTPQYMAPEQIERPTEVDHRADIYSLGVMFYEMLTGELPLGRFSPPSQKVQIDIRIDEIVLRTLEKEPARRYQQVSDVRTELDSVSSSPYYRPAKPLKPVAKTTAGAEGLLNRLFAWSAAGLRVSRGAVTSFFVPTPPPGKPLSSQSQERIRRENFGPGTALMVVGIFGFLHLLLIIAAAMYCTAPGLRHSPESRNNAEMLLVTTIVLALAQIPVSTLMILGGLNMRRTDNLGLVMIAVVMALLPLGPAWLVSLPVAIWAISVLSRRDVRQAFHEQRMV